jgi:hypothetical protein
MITRATGVALKSSARTGGTYDRLLDKLIAGDRVADERMLLLASKLGAGRRARRRAS